MVSAAGFHRQDASRRPGTLRRTAKHGMKLTLPIFWLILAIFANGAVRAGTLSEAKIGEVLHGMFDKPGGHLDRIARRYLR